MRLMKVGSHPIDFERALTMSDLTSFDSSLRPCGTCRGARFELPPIGSPLAQTAAPVDMNCTIGEICLHDSRCLGAHLTMVRVLGDEGVTPVATGYVPPLPGLEPRVENAAGETKMQPSLKTFERLREIKKGVATNTGMLTPMKRG